MHVYVYIYVYMYTSIYTYMHIHIYIYICTHFIKNCKNKINGLCHLGWFTGGYATLPITACSPIFPAKALLSLELNTLPLTLFHQPAPGPGLP